MNQSGLEGKGRARTRRNDAYASSARAREREFSVLSFIRREKKYLQLEHVNDYVSSRKLIDFSLPRMQIERERKIRFALCFPSLSPSLLFMSNIRFSRSFPYPLKINDKH